MSAQHEINRLTIQINGKVSDAYRRHLEQMLPAMLGEIFDRHFPGENVSEISSISLDLGTIASVGFDGELQSRITRLLNREFAAATRTASDLVPESPDKDHSQRDLLIAYLTHGYARGLRSDLNVLFGKWMEKDPLGLADALSGLQHSRQVRERLVNQVDYEWLRKYWSRIYGTAFVQIDAINSRLLDDQSLTGSGFTAVRKLLAGATFQFLISGDVWDRTQQRYLEVVRQTVTRAADGSDPAPGLLRGLFGRKKSEPVGASSRSGISPGLMALIRFAETGLQPGRAIPAPDQQSLRMIAEWTLTDRNRMETGLSRILAKLDSGRIRNFLSYLEPAMPARIRALLYLGQLLQRLFSVDLFEDFKPQVSILLAATGREQDIWFSFSDQVIPTIGARKGMSTTETLTPLRKAVSVSFYSGATMLRTWLDRADIAAVRQRRARDPLEALVQYLQTGNWSLPESPQAVFQSRLKQAPAALLNAWRKIAGSNVAWTRLLTQYAWSDVEEFLMLAYPEDGKLAVLRDKMRGAKDQQRVVRSFLELRTMKEITPDDFREELISRLKKRRVATSDSFIPEISPEDAAGPFYVSAFIHWVRYGTFLSAELESDGTRQALARVRTGLSAELMSQLKSLPGTDTFLRRLLLILPQEDKSLWFNLLAPRFSGLWTSVADAAGKLSLESDDIFVRLVLLSLANMETGPSDFRLDRLLNQLAAPEDIRREEWMEMMSSSAAPDAAADTDPELIKGISPEMIRAGVAPQHQADHTLTDLVLFVLRNRSFPAWSSLYAPDQFSALLNRVILAHPAYWVRFFDQEFGKPGQLENFLSLVGADAAIGIFSKVSSIVAQSADSIPDLVRAHAVLGSPQAVKEYFQMKFLLARYREPAASGQELVQIILQGLANDFGISLQEHRRLLDDSGSGHQAIRTFLARPFGESEGNNAIDTILYLALMGKPPWWAPQTAVDGIPELLESLLGDSADALFRAVDRTADPGRFYRSVFSEIKTDLFLRMAEARFRPSGQGLSFAAELLASWQIPSAGWFRFTWDFLTASGWSDAKYASALLDFIPLVSGNTQVETAEKMLLALDAAKRPASIANPYREAAELILKNRKVEKPSDRIWTDSDWASLFRSYLLSGVLRGPAEQTATLPRFLSGLSGYADRNVSDAENIIRDAWASEGVFNRLVREETVEFLEILLRATAGNRLPSLTAAWLAVKPDIAALYAPQSADWWSRAWTQHLLTELRASRKLLASPEVQIAEFLLAAESRIQVAGIFTSDQLMARGLSEKLISELNEMGLRLLADSAGSVPLIAKYSPSEWERALKAFLITGRWLPEFNLPIRVSLAPVLRQQRAFTAAELRLLLIRLLADQALLDSLRKRNDIQSAEAILEQLYPVDYSVLRSVGYLLLDLVFRLFQFLPSLTIRWEFYRILFALADEGLSPREIIARFAAFLSQRYGLNALLLVDALRTAGYPPQWLDVFLADAGLDQPEPTPTPVQLVAEKVAFFDPQATMNHYLRDGAWPMHVDHAGFSLRSFLVKARNESAYKATLMLAVIRNAIGGEQIRNRIARDRSDDVFRTLRDFIFSDHIAELDTLQQLITYLYAARPQDELLTRMKAVMLDLMSENYSDQLPFESILIRVLSGIRKLYTRDGLSSGKLSAAGFPWAWISILQRSAVVDSVAGEKEDLLTDIPGESDLLIYLVLNDEIPWWAGRFGISELNREAISRLLSKVLRHDPQTLVSHIQSSGQPQDVFRKVLRYAGQSDFFTLLSVWPAGIRQLIIPFTRLAAGTLANFVPESWYVFVIGHLQSVNIFSDKEFLTAALGHLARMEGKSVPETYRMIASAEGARNTGEIDVQLLLSSLTQVVPAPESDPAALAGSPLVDFPGIVLKFLRTGSVAAGLLPEVQSQDDFFRLLKQQAMRGNTELIQVFRTSVVERAVRERLLRSDNAELLGLAGRMLFPRLFTVLDHYRRLLFRFFRNQNQFLTEEKFGQIFFGAMITAFGEQESDTDGIAKVLARVLKEVKVNLRYTAPIRTGILRRYGFGDEILTELVRTDSGVEAGEEPAAGVDMADDVLDIRNAGLVILWPFLTRYFDLLEITEKGAFKSDELAARAVLLLQFIATGRTEAAEHELLLNKILCGLRSDIPVPREIELVPKEMEITDMMLKGVLQNWEKLKNSSVDALREGFLVRDGYLREKESLWELRVDKKTIDILMQSMPWSFGTIKLPWMNKRIVVEWI